MTRLGILNPWGDIWTPTTFDTEAEARDYMARYSTTFKPALNLSKHTVVPVRVTVSVANPPGSKPHTAAVAGLVERLRCTGLGCAAEAAALIEAAPDGLDAAVSAYTALLSAVDVRHRFQPQLCALRDFIAKTTGRRPQDVQDEYDGLVLTALAKTTTAAETGSVGIREADETQTPTVKIGGKP